MTDPFLNQKVVLDRLIQQHDEHGKLIIAFDFDSTVYDYYGDGSTFPKLLTVLREVKRRGWPLMIFTCRTGKALDEAVEYCKNLKIEPDLINKSTINPRADKPYYNLLLDDRAGLYSAYLTLVNLLETTKEQYESITSNG